MSGIYFLKIRYTFFISYLGEANNQPLVIMFDLDAFVHSPSLDELESFKKSDIIVICKHYQLECKASMVKSTLVKLIAQHLVDEQISGEDFQKLIDSGDQDRFVKLKELENKSKELELKSRELELRSLESERDHDLQREKLAIERDKISRDKQERAYFDPSRVCKLVPPFKEQDIDQYFTHFEKVASNLNGLKKAGHLCYRLYSQEKLGKRTMICRMRRVKIMKL